LRETDHPAGAERVPVSRLDSALEVFETFREELAALLHEVREGDTARAKKLSPVVTELSRAVGALAKEVQHAEETRRRNGGEREAGTLDLDLARAEIRRRLSRLRAARGGAEISDGAD